MIIQNNNHYIALIYHNSCETSKSRASNSPKSRSPEVATAPSREATAPTGSRLRARGTPAPTHHWLRRSRSLRAGPVFTGWPMSPGEPRGRPRGWTRTSLVRSRNVPYLIYLSSPTQGLTREAEHQSLRQSLKDQLNGLAPHPPGIALLSFRHFPLTRPHNLTSHQAQPLIRRQQTPRKEKNPRLDKIPDRNLQLVLNHAVGRFDPLHRHLHHPAKR
jgi:hypothetical protein